MVNLVLSLFWYVFGIRCLCTEGLKVHNAIIIHGFDKPPSSGMG